MDTENNEVGPMDWYYNPDPKAQAERDAFEDAYVPKLYALMAKVKAGEMTEDECVAAALQLQKDLGDESPHPARDAAEIRRRLYHYLRPDERDRLWREEGILGD